MGLKTGGVRHELQVKRQCGLQVWKNFFAMEAENQKDRLYFDDLQASLSHEAHVSSPTQPIMSHAADILAYTWCSTHTHLRYHPPLILSSFHSLTHPSIHPSSHPQHPIFLVPIFPLSSHSPHSSHSSHSSHLPSLPSLPTFSHWLSFCLLVGSAGRSERGPQARWE